MKEVGIIDYGSGNFTSVKNAVLELTDSLVVIREKKDLDKANRLILPGVGTFGFAMDKLKELDLIDSLNSDVLVHKKPFLGICVGMQILATKGFEHTESEGLGWVDATVVKLKRTQNLPIPHIGWNQVNVHAKSRLFEHSLEPECYFVHSYYLDVEKSNKVDDYVLSQTEYCHSFTSMIEYENIFGVQFHPEKSQYFGNLLLNNFIKV